MTKIESYAPGSFCWAELATSDPAAAKKFYASMFGWTALDNPMPEGVYTLMQVEGLDAAGLASMPGVPNHWGVHFSVASADDVAAKITAAGGKILAGPFDAHDFGRMAVAQDPQGATFSIWEAKKSIGATYGGMFNRIMWPELATSQPAAAAGFYTKVFGWGTKPETGIDAAQYTEWQLGGRSIGGLMPMSGDQWAGVPPHWMIYITVVDCDERAAHAQAIGGKVCVPPTDIPNVGRFSVITDPQGVTFSIIQMSALPHTA